MTAARDLAERLLDAQVEFVLADLTGERLRLAVSETVDEGLASAATLTLDQVGDAGQLKAVINDLFAAIAQSPLTRDAVVAVADRLYELEASEEHRLGAVIDREPVEALVAKVLAMRTLHDRALDRFAESPLVAVVASKFVTKIINDFLAQNRARAERLPGMSSLLSIGTSAANRVRSPFDQLLGDAADKSTQYALRRTNSAIREMLRDAPLQQAAMELWDLHADEPISDLRAYLSAQDLRELALLVLDVLAGARDSEYSAHVVDACVDVVFDRYGRRDVASLLTEIGLGRDHLVAAVLALTAPALEAAQDSGVLAELVRARLEPFYRSEFVLGLLDGHPDRMARQDGRARPDTAERER